MAAARAQVVLRTSLRTIKGLDARRLLLPLAIKEVIFISIKGPVDRAGSLPGRLACLAADQ